MRSRKLLVAVAASLALLASRAPASRPTTHRPAEAQGGRTRSASSCSSEGKTSTTARRRRARSCPRPTRSSGAPSPSSCCSVLLASSPVPAIKKGMDARTERIRGDLDEAEQAKAEAEPILAEYQAQLADAKNESAASSRRPARPPTRSSATRSQRPQAELAEIAAARRAGGHRGRQGRRPSPTSGARSRTLAIGAGREGRRAQPRPRHQARAHRELHQPGRSDELMDADDRIDGYADGALRGRPGRGHRSARSRTSCSASPDRRGQRRAARRRSPTRHPRPSAGRDRRGPARRQGVADHRQRWCSIVVGAGRARDLPAIIDRWSSAAAAQRNKEVAEVRSAVPLTDDQQARLAEALVAGHRQAGRGQGHRRPVRARRRRRPVGDTVIDGTVRHRLDQLKERALDSRRGAVHGRAHHQRRRHRRGAAQEASRASSPRSSSQPGRPRPRGRRRHRPRRPACPTRRSTSCSSSRTACSASR